MESSMNKIEPLEKMSEIIEKTAIKAADLDFYDLLQRQVSEGTLFFNQRRAIIFDVAAMGTLRQGMIETVGLELAMGIMMRFGYAQGYQDAKTLSETFAWQTDMDWLAAGPTLHMLEGIVHVEPQHIDYDREGGNFYMHGIWRNSYEAEEHLKRYGLSHAPVCWTLTGYASGYGTYFFGQEILAIETECVGKGDERCYFEIRPLATWGEEAAAYRQALQEVNISRQIQETYQQLQRQTQQLRESEQRFRSLYVRTPAMLHSLDIAGRLVEVSEAWLEGLGYDRAEVIGRFIGEFMTQESRYFAETEVIPNFIKTGNTQDIAYQFVKKNGQVIDIQLSAIAQYNDEGEFTQSLTVLTDVTKRKRAEALVTKRALELETVAGVSAAASTILDTDKLLWEVANLTKTRFNLYHAHIYLLNKAGDTLELVAGAGSVGEKMVAQAWQIPLKAEQSLVARAARTRKGIIVNDVQQEPGFLANLLLPDTRSELAVPMIVGEQLLGVLDVQAAETNRFSQEDAYIQTTLAAQVAISLENARLFERQRVSAAEIEDQARRLAVLNELGTGLLATYNTDEAFQMVASRTNQIVSGDRTGITLLNTTGDYFEYYAMHGAGEQIAVLPAATTSLGWVVRENRTIMIPDLREYDGDDARAIVKQGYLSSLVAPLSVGGRPIGTVNVVSRQTSAFSVRDEALIRQVASLLASTVENHRLFEQTERALAETEILYHIGTQLNAITDINEVLRVITLPEIAPNVGSITLLLFETNEIGQPEWAELVAASIYDEVAGDVLAMPIGTRFYLPEFPLTKLWLLDVEEVTLISSIVDDARIDAELRVICQAANAQALAVIPLTLGGRWIGLVSMLWTHPHHFAERNQRLYRSIAGQTAVVVNNWLLLRQAELRAAQLENLSHMEIALAQVNSEVEILATIATHLELGASATLTLEYLDVDEQGQRPTRSQVVAIWQDGAMQVDDPRLGQFYNPENIPLFTLWVDNATAPLFISNMENDPRLTPRMKRIARRRGFQAIIILPLFSGGRWQGLISIIRAEVWPFTPTEEFIFEQMLEPIAAVVTSQRAYVSQQAALAATEKLYEAGRQLIAAKDLQEVVAVVAEAKIVPLINRVVLLTFESDSLGRVEAITVAANWHSGQGTPPSPIGRRYSPESFSQFSLFFGHEPVFYSDAQQDERVDPLSREVFQRQNIRALMGFPLWVGGRQLGILVLEAEESHEFTDREIQPYLSLAAQIAIAVDNQRLLAETHVALAEVEATQRRYTLQAWESYQNRQSTSSYETLRNGLKVKNEGASLKHTSSDLVVPLKIRDETIGVVGLAETDESRVWLPEEVALVEAIAREMAQTAENLRLLDETQLRAAREKRVNEIGDKIQAAQSLEEALQIAVKEVGLSLQVPQTNVQLEIK